MKKSVIFIICVIYGLSIFIVTLFGMKIKVDQFEIYMTDLTITSYDSESKKGIKLKTIYKDETQESVKFRIEYEYKPENASYPNKIKFSISDNVKKKDGEEVVVAQISSLGIVEFFAVGTVTVRVYATDGSNQSDTLEITCELPPQQ